MYRQALCALVTSLALMSATSACDDSTLSYPTDSGSDGDASTAELDSKVGRMQLVPLVLGAPVSAELAAKSPTYLFSFTLTAPAAISLRTQATEGGPIVDTVITLSRIDQRGLPRAIGTSDDFDGSKFSGLDRTLSKGTYQLLVRGFTLRNRGPFVLASSCAGAGCPVLPAVCLFGEQFSDLRTSSLLTIESEEWLTSEAQLTTALMRDQVVLAVQQSAHADVTTPAAALAAVDQHEIRHMELRETNGTRAFTVYEYGAGDNSYGAIFAAGTLTIAASIHDGDLASCTVSP